MDADVDPFCALVQLLQVTELDPELVAPLGWFSHLLPILNSLPHSLRTAICAAASFG